MADIYEQIAEFVKALTRRERKASQLIFNEYAAAYKQINKMLIPLYKEYEAAFTKGELTQHDLSVIYKIEQYHLLRAQIAAELKEIKDTVEGITLTEIEQSWAAAERDIDLLFRTQLFPERVGAELRFNKLPDDAFKHYWGAAQSTVLSNRLANIYAASVDDVITTIGNGLLFGFGPRQIERNVRRTIGRHISNTIVVVRTEILRAYRTAAVDTYRQNGDVIMAWRWRSARNERTCAMCWALDGQVFTLDDELTDHPNGRCYPVPVARPWAALGFRGEIHETLEEHPTGKEAFDDLPPEKQEMILGRSKFKAYQAGDIADIRDLVGLRYNKDWGWQHYEKSLKEMGIDWRTYWPPKVPAPVGAGATTTQVNQGTRSIAPKSQPREPQEIAAVDETANKYLDTVGELIGRREFRRIDTDTDGRLSQWVDDDIKAIDKVIKLRPSDLLMDVEGLNPRNKDQTYLERLQKLIVGSDAERQSNGYFTNRAYSGNPYKRGNPVINLTRSARVGTFVHEFGHFLDWATQGRTPEEMAAANRRLTPKGWGISQSMSSEFTLKILAQYPGDLGKLWGLLGKSKMVQSIQATKDSHPEYNYFSQYLLSPVEIWARTFEQYIAKKSGSRVLQYDVDKSNQDHREGSELFKYFHDEDDFTEIEQVIDKIFRERGILR